MPKFLFNIEAQKKSAPGQPISKVTTTTVTCAGKDRKDAERVIYHHYTKVYISNWKQLPDSATTTLEVPQDAPASPLPTNFIPRHKSKVQGIKKRANLPPDGWW